MLSAAGAALAMLRTMQKALVDFYSTRAMHNGF